MRLENVVLFIDFQYCIRVSDEQAENGFDMQSSNSGSVDWDFQAWLSVDLGERQFKISDGLGTNSVLNQIGTTFPGQNGVISAPGGLFSL